MTAPRGGDPFRQTSAYPPTQQPAAGWAPGNAIPPAVGWAPGNARQAIPPAATGRPIPPPGYLPAGYPPPGPLPFAGPPPGERPRVAPYPPVPTPATTRVPAPTLAYPLSPPAWSAASATGRVELAPGFEPPGSHPGRGVPYGPAGDRPGQRDRRRPRTLVWLGVAAAVLTAAFVLAMTIPSLTADRANSAPPATGQTADPSAGPSPTAETAPAPGGPPAGAPSRTTDAPTTRAPATGAPGTDPTGSAVPADPGWPPSRIPTSLLPRSSSGLGADPAGGVVAARTRVAGFVAALNDDDPDAANSYLCRHMAGAFGDGMLSGIVQGSVGVGGVTVSGQAGTAYITYQPTGGGDPEQSKFGLVVENGQWMICDPP